MEARANNDRHRQRQQKLKEQVDTRVAAATEKKGILIVFTGNGKGKSTAAFGTATRAVGHGKTVGIAQFIKGQWDNGEYNTLQPLGVEFHIMGTGFTWETQNRQADIEAATQKVVRYRSELTYASYQLKLSTRLAKQGAGPEEDVQKWRAKVASDEAAIKEAQADELRAKLRYNSQVNGVNTTVAATEAELAQARYYLDNTLMTAPEDGHIINLQVRPGMVAGEVRFGAIASFICDADRYLLANFFQENLKYVKPGQETEAAIDLYPGQIFKGKVQAIWRGSGAGQMLPSGTLPNFQAMPTGVPQGQFAVAITLDDLDQEKFPIGTQGQATIYTNPSSGFAILRRIGIRAYSWFNWLYPFSG